MSCRMTVEKYFAALGEYWTNVYWLAGTDVTAFTAEVTAVVNAEKAIYPSSVVITKVRVDDAVQDTDNFRTYVFNVAGTNVDNPGSESAPLWVTARVDFAAGTGRPSRKYLRGTLREAEYNSIELTAAKRTLLQTYADAIVATAAIVDVDGQDFASAAVFNGPQMRQLRRGSKKKPTP